MEPPPVTDDQEADQALRDARSRFVAAFTQRHNAMGSLLAEIESGGEAAPLGALRQGAHKMAGIAGVVGFPSVSQHASSLETALLQQPIDVDGGRAALVRMADGFTRDLAGPAPSWAADVAHAAVGARILVVEDDQEQRRLAATGLRAAGYRVVTAESGAEAVQTAIAERPDLILLDVDLPDLDGLAVCRQLKLSPALSSVPVILCTARTGVMDRMAGLTLGADDYVTKPFEPGDLLLRIRRMVARAKAPAAAPAASGPLTHDLFLTSAAAQLAGGDGALLMIRLAPADLERVAQRLMEELRRRDVVGRLSDTHLVVFIPRLTAAAAKAALRQAIDATQPPFGEVAIGAVDAVMSAAGTPAIDALIAAADLALAQDRAAQSGADAGKLTVLLAEDDADVLHIMDTRVRAAGYRTVMSLDGQQTLDAIEREFPAVVLLDLMMPKLTGFDVLMRLRDRPRRPRIIVVSARGRDDDVTRAFELGADDYVTKPFNPEELVARIVRLTR